MIVRDKERFRAWLRQTEEPIPLFLDADLYDIAVGSDNWDVILYLTEGRVSACFLFYRKRKWGIPYITMPPLIKYGGCWISSDCQDVSSFDWWNHLPTIYAMDMKGFPGINNDAVDKDSYEKGKNYTYIIPDLSKIESVWRGLSRDYRNNKIPKAKSLGLEVRQSQDLNAFWEINLKTFHRQGVQPDYTYDYVCGLHKYWQEKKRSQIFVAQSTESVIYSVAYVVWDDDTAYLLMAGDDPRYRHTGSAVLLTWEILQWASERGFERFDFLGSMIPGVERTRKQFGGVREYYPTLTYHSPLYKWASRL